ncbi:hypothetical protein GIB67_043132 [Kingdonia uniflora]|uniref:F-box domain-containing protein n=1 Tax=Kingdonia uniflora TaxID=39325 RepID=A0A7J7NJ41_9MAGN|nr:hypothetical protein GIB67_043132 [Kingdonia uniflora]
MKNIRVMPSLEEFPPEIITNIVLRLPIKCLVQCRCVSKPWCSMIDEPHFAKMYLSVGVKPISTPSNRIMVSVRRVAPLGYEHYIAEDTDEGLVIKGTAKIDLPINTYYAQNPSNGLVILESDSRHYICNPATGKCLLIATESRKRLLFGMGFSLSSQEFKVVQVRTYSVVGANTHSSRFEVFTLGTQGRRTAGSLPYRLRCSCLYFNGSLHWIVHYEYSNMGSESFTTLRIVSFNLDSEAIGEFPKPEINFTSKLERTKSRTYLLGVLGDYLSLWDFQISDPIEVWVMKDYKVKESWTKQYSIIQSQLSYCVEPLCLRKNGDLLLHVDQKYFVSYN